MAVRVGEGANKNQTQQRGAPSVTRRVVESKVIQPGIPPEEQEAAIAAQHTPEETVGGEQSTNKQEFAMQDLMLTLNGLSSEISSIKHNVNELIVAKRQQDAMLETFVPGFSETTHQYSTDSNNETVGDLIDWCASQDIQLGKLLGATKNKEVAWVATNELIRKYGLGVLKNEHLMNIWSDMVIFSGINPTVNRLIESFDTYYSNINKHH